MKEARDAAGATYRQVARLMRRAIAAEMRRLRTVTEIEAILAGPQAPEQLRFRVESVVSEWIDNCATDLDDAGGFSIENAKEMIEEI